MLPLSMSIIWRLSLPFLAPSTRYLSSKGMRTSCSILRDWRKWRRKFGRSNWNWDFRREIYKNWINWGLRKRSWWKSWALSSSILRQSQHTSTSNTKNLNWNVLTTSAITIFSVLAPIPASGTAAVAAFPKLKTSIYSTLKQNYWWSSQQCPRHRT